MVVVRKAFRWLWARSTREKAALILLVVASLGNVRLLRSVVDYYQSPVEDADNIASYEQRLVPLKAELPSDAVVGYIDDGRPAPGSIRGFMLTRYALAPVRVVYSASPSLVVANLENGHSRPCGRGAANLVLVRDFGRGVQLYRNRAGD